MVAVEYLGTRTNQKYVRHYWKCSCDCGKEVVRELYKLLTTNPKICSHTCRALIHPLRDTPTYKSWQKMLARTRYEEYEEWHSDVTVCDRWDNRKGGSFENFVEDMGERPEGSTLNRINGSKIYSPETCEWATLSLQSYDQKKSKVNTSGRTGVSWNKRTNKWVATIKKNRKSKYLYSGDSFELACKAREKAELEMYGFTKE